MSKMLVVGFGCFRVSGMLGAEAYGGARSLLLTNPPAAPSRQTMDRNTDPATDPTLLSTVTWTDLRLLRTHSNDFCTALSQWNVGGARHMTLRFRVGNGF